MKQTLFYRGLLGLGAIAAIAAMPSRVLAHQVQTNYFLNGSGDQLELQTTFSNGEPLKGAKVTVYAPDQPYRAQAVGKTDEQGRFTFAPEQAISGDWEVNIERAGHQDILTVPVNETGIDAELLAQTESIDQTGLGQVAARPIIIDETGVVDQGGTDLHYATNPWGAVAGSAVIALATLGYARATKRSSKP